MTAANADRSSTKTIRNDHGRSGTITADHERSRTITSFLIWVRYFGVSVYRKLLTTHVYWAFRPFLPKKRKRALGFGFDRSIVIVRDLSWSFLIVRWRTISVCSRHDLVFSRFFLFFSHPPTLTDRYVRVFFFVISFWTSPLWIP